MSDFPCFDSEISVSGLKFSVHTELVPSGAAFKVNTYVSSSDGAVFSFNSPAGENFSEEDIRSRHNRIIEKVSSNFSLKESSGSGNNVDFAALYIRKEFRPSSDASNKMAENTRKTLIFENE